MSRHFHVAKTGCDGCAGSEQRPLLTIQAAAELAGPGDVVIVHEGVYREYVNPKRGGSSSECRITYKAAEGERVVISGGEIISDWQLLEGNVYKTEIDKITSLSEVFNLLTRTQVWSDWFNDRYD
jgi:hypothetical protein